MLATTTPDEPSAFVRVLLLPEEWAGKRTIRYVDPGRCGEAEDASARRSYSEQPVAAVSRSGGQVLVDQLVLHGADLAFGVPGESYLPCSTRCTTRRCGWS